MDKTITGSTTRAARDKNLWEKTAFYKVSRLVQLQFKNHFNSYIYWKSKTQKDSEVTNEEWITFSTLYNILIFNYFT